MPSGGYRAPNQPAAVSGPGRFSTRTDTGTAQLAAPGGGYGERQAIEGQAAAAPVPVGGQSGGGGAGAPVQGPVGGDMGAFAPTDRPGESPIAGSPAAYEEPQMTSTEILRIIFDRYPSPWIAGLIGD